MRVRVHADSEETGCRFKCNCALFLLHSWDEDGCSKSSRLFAYNKIDGEMAVSPGSQKRGTRARQRAPMSWESHLGDGAEKMGEEGEGADGGLESLTGF